MQDFLIAVGLARLVIDGNALLVEQSDQRLQRFVGVSLILGSVKLLVEIFVLNSAAQFASLLDGIFHGETFLLC